MSPDRTLRVGIDASCLVSRRGPGRYLASMLCALAVHADLDLQPFLPSNDTGPWDLPDAVTGRAHTWTSRVLPWLSLRVPLLSRQVRADITWFPANDGPGWGCQPYVLTLHDIAQLHYPDRFFETPTEHRRFVRRLKAVVRGAAWVVTGSVYSRRDIVELTGCDPDSVSVIPYAADPGLGPLDPEDARRLVASLGVRVPFLLFVGGFDFRKNLPRLIEAFSDLVRRGVPHSLVLVGGRGANPKLYPDLQPHLARSDVEGRVVILDTGVDDTSLRGLYCAAEAFVFPSLFEGFGLPPLEAMACGTPVACSKAASLPEVVGDAAVLFDAEDVGDIIRAIEHVLTGAALREDLRSKGRVQAARFSWRRTADAFRSVLWESSGRGHAPRMAPSA